MGTIKKLKRQLRAYAKKQATQNRLLAKCAAEVLYLQLQWKGDLPGNNILKTIDTFVPKEKQADKQYLRKLKKDMLFSRLYHQTINTDYFLFAFEDKSDCGRKKYIGWFELKELFRQLNLTGRQEAFDNKENTFLFFRDYTRRDVLPLHEITQKDAFVAFACAHRPCLLKPLTQLGGRGIVRIEAADEESAAGLFDAYAAKLPFLLEEMIIQDPGMAKYHPQSVNTIRYTTFFHEGELNVLQAVLRMGRGESIVDNATSGGIYALVDPNSGVVIGPARSEKAETYFFHPDTGEQIIGSRIPRWDELGGLAEKAARVIPEQKLVGWDFALSSDGWILVEANVQPAIQSFDFDHGLRDQIADTFGRVVPVKRWN